VKKRRRKKRRGLVTVADPPRPCVESGKNETIMSDGFTYRWPRRRLRAHLLAGRRSGTWKRVQLRRRGKFEFQKKARIHEEITKKNSSWFQGFSTRLTFEVHIQGD
jgi:hypothetical protein